MNSMFRAGCLVFSLLCVFSGVQAQTSVADDLMKADKQFDLYAYNLALRSYERVVKQTPNNAHALARIADCYFQLNRPEEALPWYDRAAALTPVDPDVFLRYGQALMHTGDYVGAKKWFMFYSQKTPKTGRHYADMCDYALGLADKEALYTTRNELMNSEASDYGPAFLNNRVVYNSARTDIVRKTQSKTNSDWAGSAFNQLFVTQRSTDNGFLQKPNFLRSDLQNSYNEGPVSYSSDGARVAFCRNNFIDGTRQIADRGLNMSLYIADVEDGNWINVRPFPYNGSDFATGFPCLSPDGRTLYFASNQPNGLGGWDIYVSFWNGTDWTPPHNLGEPLNTPGNEITPYYDGRNFYFSSDWHPGLGGMDIFRADLKELQANNIYHLGPGVNSSRDDYGFIFDASLNLGYLTSNRTGGRGNEDVWQVRKKSPDAPTAPATTTALADSPLMFNTQTTPRTVKPADPYSALYVLVTDNKGEPLQGAEVDLRACGGNVGYTDAEGKYYFYSYSRGVDCKVTVRKEGYMETVAPVTEFGRSNIILPLATEVRRQFTGVVMDARNKLALPDVVVQYALTESGRMFETMTNSYGEYTAMMVPRSSYTISYVKSGYQSEVTTIRPGMPGTGANLPPVMLERDVTSTPTMYTDESAKRPSKPGPTFNGYAIQLAATPETVTPEYMQKYETVSRHGNVYARPDGKLTKIRVGVFSTKEEAEKALQNIRRNFTTAFLVEEKNAEETLRVGGAAAEAQKPAIYSTKTDTKGVAATAPRVLFAVQIASLNQAKSVNIMDYQAIGDIGNVYAKQENEQLKVRVGIWSNHAEAEAAKAALVKRGYRDPLIVTEKSDDTSISDLILSDATPSVKSATPATKPVPVQPVQYSTPATAKKAAPAGVRYYVRVCALSDPSNFDAQKLSGIEGTIEKWPIGSTKMVAIMLAGYPDLESAINANEKLHARGFPDAYIMREENGQMAKYKY